MDVIPGCPWKLIDKLCCLLGYDVDIPILSGHTSYYGFPLSMNLLSCFFVMNVDLDLRTWV